MTGSIGFILVIGFVAVGFFYVLIVSLDKQSSKSIRETNNLPEDYLAEGKIEFSPGLFGQFMGVGFVLYGIGLFGTLILLIFISSGIQSVLMIIGREAVDFDSLFLFASSVFFFWFFLPGLVGLVNTSSTIRVIRDGLLIRVLKWRFYWVFIKWDDIVRIRKWRPHHRFKEYYWVVEYNKNELNGFIHWDKVIGGFPPGIQIGPLVQNRDRLAEIIKERIS